MESALQAKVESIRRLCEQLTMSPKLPATPQLIAESDIGLRKELKQLCHEVILVEPKLALQADVCQFLWNGLVRTVVNAYTKWKPRTTKEMMQADQSLRNFLKDEIESFTALIAAFPDVTFPRSPNSTLVGKLLWCLADLHFIWVARVAHASCVKARQYYTQACWFLPGNGSPLTELALLREREGCLLDAIYHFTRAIGADQPCDAARKHVAALWKREAEKVMQEVTAKPRQIQTACDLEAVLEKLAVRVFAFIGAPRRKWKPMSAREVAKSRKAADLFSSHMLIIDLSLVPRCLWLQLTAICIFLLHDSETLTSPHFENLRGVALSIFGRLALSVREGSIMGVDALYIALAWLCRGSPASLKNDFAKILVPVLSTMQRELRSMYLASTALSVEQHFCGFLGLFRGSCDLPSSMQNQRLQNKMLMSKIAQCVHTLGWHGVVFDGTICHNDFNGDDNALTDEESRSATLSDCTSPELHQLAVVSSPAQEAFSPSIEAAEHDSHASSFNDFHGDDNAVTEQNSSDDTCSLLGHLAGESSDEVGIVVEKRSAVGVVDATGDLADSCVLSSFRHEVPILVGELSALDAIGDQSKVEEPDSKRQRIGG